MFDIFPLLRNLVYLKNYYIAIKTILVLLLKLICLYFKCILKYTVELLLCAIYFILLQLHDQSCNYKYI